MTLILLFAGLALLCLVLLLCLSSLSVPVAVLISFAVFLLLHLLCLTLFRLIAGTTPTDRPITKQNRLCRWAAPYMVDVLNVYAGIRVSATGTEMIPTDSRFLFVSNHRSMFDPTVIMAALRDADLAFISKPSNMRIPLGGRIAYSIGFLAIDRENNRNALKTILTAADYLKKDICNIVIFPEGTRSKTKELLPFHAGSFKIAQRANVPVVVAAVSGTDKLRRWVPFRRTLVHLDILEVIPAETVSATRTEALAEEARGKIQAHLTEIEEG